MYLISEVNIKDVYMANRSDHRDSIKLYGDRIKKYEHLDRKDYRRGDPSRKIIVVSIFIIIGLFILAAIV